MAPSKRRSARIASKETLTSPRDIANFAVGKLSSLLERDETPKTERSINTIMSPSARADRMPGSFDPDESLLKTPDTVPHMRPSESEMHPSKVQQSTTKEPDSGLRLGFSDIKDIGKPPLPAVDTTPSKSTMELKSPGFEFKWAKKNENDLSNEAQRIMDSVREEAARIKEQMKAERDEQVRQDIQAGLVSPVSGRKMATPRRKGRFSDVHQAEFAKMESITTHVSILKNATPVSAKGLKRTQSRAELADESSLSAKSSERPQNSSPGKRMRINLQDDASSARPVSPKSPSSALTHPRLGFPSAITTPTKSSLARAASAKGLRTFSRVPQAISSKAFRSPAAPKSEGSNKYLSALSRAPSIKSILHKPALKYSSDPMKIAQGTHVALPEGAISPKHLTLPGSQPPTIPHTPTIKRVGFALELEAGKEKISPISSKVAGKSARPLPPPSRGQGLSSHPPTARDFTFQASPSRPLKFGPPAVASPTRPTVRCVRPSGINTPITSTSTLAGVPHGMPNKKRRRADDNDEEDDNVENRPPGSTKRVKQTTGIVAYPKLSPEKPISQLDAAEKRKSGLTPKKPLLSLSRLHALARPKKRT